MKSRIESRILSLQILSYCIVGIIIILVGFIYSLQNNITHVIQVEIDPTNLVSIIATIWLGLYLAKNINKKDTESRIEKNIIISIIEKLEIEVDVIDAIVNDIQNTQPVELTKITKAFHILLQKHNHLEKTATLCEMNITQAMSDFKRSIMLMRRISTGGSLDPQGNVIVPPNQIQALADEMSLIHETLIKSKILINRS